MSLGAPSAFEELIGLESLANPHSQESNEKKRLNPGLYFQNSISMLITCLFLSEKLHLECFH